MPLKRKQIYPDSENETRIRKLAKATGLSEAEHIRRAIASYVAAIPETGDGRHPLMSMIEICDRRAGDRTHEIASAMRGPWRLEGFLF